MWASNWIRHATAIMSVKVKTPLDRPYITIRDTRAIGFRIAAMFGAELLDARHVLLLYRASCRAGASLPAHDECGVAICTRGGSLRRLAALFAMGVYDANALLLAMCRLPGAPVANDYLAVLNALAAMYAADTLNLLRLANAAAHTMLPLERHGHTPRSFEEVRRATIASNFRLMMQKIVDDLSEPDDYEFPSSDDDESAVGDEAAKFAEMLIAM